MSALAPERLAVAWHDAECGSYAADLPLWRELAAAARGPVLDLGCGTGRVAADLAARGHGVTGVDCDPALLRALAARSPGVRTVAADARSLVLGRRFALAIAPMQVVQLLGGASGRAAFLTAVRGHLERGALLAAALADPFADLPAEDALLPLPDVREEGGWVLSSQPVAVRRERDALAIDRVRQAVSPAGELSEELVTVRLDRLEPSELEAEAASHGFSTLPARHVEATAEHVGSTVVLLEAR